jgi:hypothetical protein
MGSAAQPVNLPVEHVQIIPIVWAVLPENLLTEVPAALAHYIVKPAIRQTALLVRVFIMQMALTVLPVHQNALHVD